MDTNGQWLELAAYPTNKNCSQAFGQLPWLELRLILGPAEFGRYPLQPCAINELTARNS